MAVTLPLMMPPSLQMDKMLSQFFLNSAFSWERTTVPFLVFELLDEHVNLIADFHGLQVQKFIAGDDTFAVVADVHEDFVLAEFDDGAFDDFALAKRVALCFMASSIVSILLLCNELKEAFNPATAELEDSIA